MCMEDIRIGRESTWFYDFVIATDSVFLLVPADPHRISLIIDLPGGGTMVVSPKQDMAVNEGIRIAAGTGRLDLKLIEHGRLVCAAWYGYTGIAAVRPVVAGSTLARER